MRPTPIHYERGRVEGQDVAAATMCRRWAARVTWMQTGLPVERVELIERAQGLDVGVTLQVLDASDPTVRNGMPLRVGQIGHTPWSVLSDMAALGELDQYLVMIVRKVIVDTCSHEVDECLRVDGKPVPGLHPEQERT